MGKYVITNECINCGACAGICPVGAIAGKGVKHEIDPAICIACGACAGECPVGAIEEGK